MANDWFRFKQFEIRQERCAMKVGTDGVILGAWIDVDGVQHALDVGTGTGLLALMLAQRNVKLIMDAVEIDQHAAEQAKENVLGSPFKDRIHIQHLGFGEFIERNQGTGYDLVICNPPYYSGSLRPPLKNRSYARHDEMLTLEDLFSGAERLVGSGGVLGLVLPYEHYKRCLTLSVKYGFFVRRLLKVFPVPEKPPKRICLEFARHRTSPEEQMLVIEAGGRHQYSAEYLSLTYDFYL